MPTRKRTAGESRRRSPSTEEWVSASSRNPDDLDLERDRPMTEDQATRLRFLCAQAIEPFDASLSRSEADARIAALERKTGRSH